MRRSLPSLVTFVTLCAVAGAGTAAAAGTDPPISTVPPGGGLTVEAVVAAVDHLTESPFRFEVFVGFTSPELTVDGDVALLTGSAASGRSAIEMDLGTLFAELTPPGEEELPLDFLGADLTVDVIADGTDLYVRAPFLAAFAGAFGPTDDLGALGELGNGWGYVDLAGVMGSIPGMPDLPATQGLDVATMLGAFDALGELEQLGSEPIRGVMAEGVRAELDLTALADTLGVPMESIPPDAQLPADLTAPVELWLDDRLMLRRATITLDEAVLSSVDDLSGGISYTAGDSGTVTFTVDLFDYDAPDIVITPPEKFVDITTAVTDLVSSDLVDG